MIKKIAPAIIFMLVLALPVAADSNTTITYSDVTCLNLDWGCSSKLFVFYPDNTLAGQLNGTNDIITVNSSQPLHFELKPSSASLLNNPYIILPWVLNMFQGMIVIVFVFAFPISTFYIIRRLFIGKDPIQQQGWGKWKKWQ